jgi:hypothetical protein
LRAIYWQSLAFRKLRSKIPSFETFSCIRRILDLIPKDARMTYKLVSIALLLVAAALTLYVSVQSQTNNGQDTAESKNTNGIAIYHFQIRS